MFFSLTRSALFAFYATNPEKLDPTIKTDQIFPLFIANEMPVGLAGLLLQVSAAAQSTVSTSMNLRRRLATDFMKLKLKSSDSFI